MWQDIPSGGGASQEGGGPPGYEVQKKNTKNGPPLEASLEQLYPPLIGIDIQSPSTKGANKESKNDPNELKTKFRERLREMLFGYTIYYVSAT